MIYIYEGILSSGATLVQLGEEQFGQEGINFGFTLDGTKDSCKFEVYSYRKASVKPFSVVCHHETSSWWVVSKDKVERFTNEQGWIYKHSLQCVGAIELLNARDLTNCAFNQGKYTIQEYVERLFELSNFEFKSPVIIHNNNLDIHQLVDYIKTFENYTLLSALREFFDGYNCSLRLEFRRNLAYNQITGVNLVITPKTGDMSLQVLDIDNDFNNVQEQRNMDKNSYGTIVVSNVDNAVSSMTKVYPNVGGTKISGNEYNITPENALIRLPSNAFWVESVFACATIRLCVSYHSYGTGGVDVWSKAYDTTDLFNVANDIIPQLRKSKETILSQGYSSFDGDDFDSKLEEMATKLYNGGTIEFRQGCRYNPQDTSWTYKDNTYVVKTLILKMHTTLPADIPAFIRGQVVLCDDDTGKATHNPSSCIRWKRGSDEITGLNWISYDGFTKTAGDSQLGWTGGSVYIPLNQTLNGETRCILYEWDYSSGAYDKAVLEIECEDVSGVIYGNVSDVYTCIFANNFAHTGISVRPFLFKVKYIPMTDLKVKLDNNEENNHTHLYNQNGKLTDVLAFSKLINSYKSEIETENIVKYSTSYELFTLGTTTFRSISCPKLGQIVLDSDNEQYIINSVSYNLYQNEPNQYVDDGTTYTQYYVECEYNLSKNVATKSLMVNPNTNIRDYGIPQKYNTRRTHLYRDFWELAHEQENYDLPYQLLSNVLNVGVIPQTYNEHTAIMEIVYSNNINGSNKWYYQLESTTYMLKKAIYECVEFKDNNIIGYDVQNMWSNFDVSKLTHGWYDLHATPISYVDDNGEFKDITICMCNKEQVQSVYDKYKDTNSITTDLPIQNMMIFIPQEIYDYAKLSWTYTYDYKILYEDYNKDALEVPVFEYCCQLDDTNDVIIGENVLTNLESDKCYLYSYKLVAKGVVNNNNWSALDEELISIDIDGTSGESALFMDNACKMELDTNEIRISLHTNIEFEKPSQNITYGSKVSMSSISDYDIVIIRHCVSDYSDTYQDDLQVDYQRNKQDLMFVIRHTENASVENDIMTICLNHWKLD